MIRIIFHVGMGLAGAETLLAAMNNSQSVLATQNAEYLGKWFDVIDARYAERSGQNAFLDEAVADPERQAARFFEALKARATANGTRVFILSNEQFFGELVRLRPFMTALGSLCDVDLTIYARPAHEWLPLAYQQWMVVHKTNTGPIQSYSEAGRRLVLNYRNILEWSTVSDVRLTVFSFTTPEQASADFTNHFGLSLAETEPKITAQPDVAETILRAYYNNQIEAPALPQRFNAAIGRASLSDTPTLENLVKACFDYDALDAQIAMNKPLLDEISTLSGVELIRDSSPRPAVPDLAETHERILEQLMFISMKQADRLTHLEQELTALMAKADAMGDQPND